MEAQRKIKESDSRRLSVRICLVVDAKSVTHRAVETHF